MTKDDFDEFMQERQKERIRRYGRLFATEDGKWVLEDLKARTTYNTSMSTKFAANNNALGLTHIAGQRDLIAWVCQVADASNLPPVVTNRESEDL